MGSKCSIRNDTEHDVWITHGINWPVLKTIHTLTFSLVKAGALVKAASPLQMIPAIEVLDQPIAKLLLDSANEDELKKRDRAFAQLIKPGEKYTWSGTLSLHMRVYVMNDTLLEERACFTGPTADSEYVYPISEYFNTLA